MTLAELIARDQALVALLWVVTAGFAWHLHILAVAVRAQRVRWHWLDLFIVLAFAEALWLGFQVFSAVLWLVIAAMQVFLGYGSWLAPASWRERHISSLLLYRYRMRLAAFISLVMISAFLAAV
ncbi:MAG: hypothetical protein AB7G62_09935 [Magnetospirillum sp.]